MLAIFTCLIFYSAPIPLSISLNSQVRNYEALIIAPLGKKVEVTISTNGRAGNSAAWFQGRRNKALSKFMAR